MADRIVYTKFSNDRARQYCIKTDIIKRDENKVVRKEALTPESRSHILAMLKTEQKLGDMLSRSKMVPNHIVGSGEDFVEFEYIEAACEIEARCTAKTVGKTGVEMEARTGVQVALLTIYDMCKAIDRGMEITEVHLLKKEGGKSGVYERSV